jgi:hypothetical protein
MVLPSLQELIMRNYCMTKQTQKIGHIIFSKLAAETGKHKTEIME